MPFAASPDTTNIRMGTCTVKFGNPGVDLGYTMGGVEVEVTTTTHETKVDQFGDTLVNEFIMGRQILVRCPLAEVSLDNLVAIMPGATKTIDGTTPTKIKVDVETGVGTSLLSLANKLVLHPIALAGGDVSEDLTLPKAATAGAMQFAYKYDEERVFNVEFKGYPDIDGILYTYGDTTATA